MTHSDHSYRLFINNTAMFVSTTIKSPRPRPRIANAVHRHVTVNQPIVSMTVTPH
ncbi:hypothetical protein [uncultured Ruminococcus sp.]|uniref:hypothetical protein n=1 Tax=uncultured Ruminococcus sp. TaxID=165186 RepID=UPI00292FA7FA|nr:hypothetical protein [uncultured Ruminococcus sp.]